MKAPLPKLKAIILYFCENTDAKFLGKVKLMKLFYYLDFLHVKKYGSPVTFDRYVKLEHGPIPSTIKNMVDDAGEDVEHSVLADTIDIVRTEGVHMHRVAARRKMTEEERKLFTESEIRILKEVCSRFGQKNTQYIEDASHKEAPWKETSMLQEIPYTLAVKDADCETSAEEIELALQILL
ncbi:MAG: Panacea domain-containing protein [Patescibacteria group bacterium]